MVRVVSSRQGGRVAIDGDEWPAVVLAEDLEIPQDVFVKVVSYDSIVLVVEPFES